MVLVKYAPSQFFAAVIGRHQKAQALPDCSDSQGIVRLLPCVVAAAAT